MYSYISPTLNTMINVARKAGKLLARDFNEISTVSIEHKSAKKFVTSADLRSEKIIIKDLEAFKPDYNFLSEESGFREGSQKNHTWIIDPLDGTTNFVQGIPFFCTTIALRKSKEITHGVIYDPILDNIYYAEKGSGAYLNNMRIRIPSKSRLDTNGVVTIDCKSYSEYEVLQQHFHYMRYCGSAALSLAYTASGKFDLFLGNDLKIWDIAAGVILIKEAGGNIDDLVKKQSVLEAPHILAGNIHQFNKFQKLLAS